MNAATCTITLCACLVITRNAFAASDIFVCPGESIQAAIDVAFAGDTIHVAAGVYTEVIDMKGKVGIKVIGTDGAENTVLDGTGFELPVVRFSGGETVATTIEGFTITGGDGTVIFDAGGGGIRFEQTSGGTVRRCMIIGNLGGRGGGIWIKEASNVLIEHCLIESNQAMSNGGGLYVIEASTPVEIRYTTIASNEANFGGGVYAFDSNGATEVSLTACNVTRNTSSVAAGGGGIYVSVTNVSLNSTVLWGNSPSNFNYSASSGGSMNAAYSDVQFGWPGVGNIDADPLFLDPLAGDFHLFPGSPCIDTGDPALPPGPDDSPSDIGASQDAVDCDGDGLSDYVEISTGAEPDCNSNSVIDSCDISLGLSTDLDRNGVPDECDADCDGDGIADHIELASGSADCNGNGIPDECDITAGTSMDGDGDGVPDECLHINAISGKLGLEDIDVVISGSGFDASASVFLDGIFEPVLSLTPTEITIQPGTADPGFMDVIVISGVDSAVVPEGLRNWPTLTATTTGAGGTISIVIENGDLGVYALIGGTRQLPTPIALMNPQTWFGLLIDPLATFLLLEVGSFSTLDPITVTIPVDNNPSFVGLDIYLQSWCQQGLALPFAPTPTNSFTNLATVTL